VVRESFPGAPVLELEGFGLLRGMRMRRAGVALQLLDHRVAERAIGQHALERVLDRPARGTGCQPAENLIGAVDDVPVPLDVLRLGGIGLHRGLAWSSSAKSTILLF